MRRVCAVRAVKYSPDPLRARSSPTRSRSREIDGSGPLVTGSGVGRAAEEPAKMAVFLFVQNAKGVTYEKGKLTLKGVTPATVLFSVRPERIAGYMATRK